MAEISPAAEMDPERLKERIAELERERQHLITVIEILEEISGSLNFVDILQTVTKKLGTLYGLDRCSIFLAERRGLTARLVASYEDPAIRNYVVDLRRYPELKRALQSGQTVFIADAQSDPAMKHVHDIMEQRGAKTITVVPIAWRSVVIGAIFLRTFRDGSTFTDADLSFCQVIGTLTARVLRNAYRYQQLVERQADSSERARRANLERVALVGFLKRLLDSYAADSDAWHDDLLSDTAGRELDRLADVARTVIREEGKGR
jgi:two-component system cell cycle response regulator